MVFFSCREGRKKERKKERKKRKEKMVNRVVGDEDIIQNSECDSGLDPQKVADGDFDEDGRSKRTGFLFSSLLIVWFFLISSNVHLASKEKYFQKVNSGVFDVCILG